MEFCRDKKVDEEVITDINIKTLSYIKNCEKQKSPRNLMLTRRYLKENQLLAVPFDKGIGICVMPTTTYDEKIKKITDLPQFQKVVPARKNAKNPILKEEERIISFLKDMNSQGKLSEALMKKLQPSGSHQDYMNSPRFTKTAFHFDRCCPCLVHRITKSLSRCQIGCR